MSLYDDLQKQADANRAASLEWLAENAAPPAPLVRHEGVDEDGAALLQDLNGDSPAGKAQKYEALGSASLLKPLATVIQGQGDGHFAEIGNASTGYRWEPLREAKICPNGTAGCTDGGWVDGIELPPFELPEFSLPDWNWPDWDLGDIEFEMPGVGGGGGIPDTGGGGGGWWCCNSRGCSNTRCPPPDKKKCFGNDVFNNGCNICNVCAKGIAGFYSCRPKKNPPDCRCSGHAGCGDCATCSGGTCKSVSSPCPPPPPPKPPCNKGCKYVCKQAGCSQMCWWVSQCTAGKRCGKDISLPWPQPDQCPGKCSYCKNDAKGLSSACAPTCKQDPCVFCDPNTGGCKRSRGCECKNSGTCPKCSSCVDGKCRSTGGCEPPPGGCPACHSFVNGKCVSNASCSCKGNNDCGRCATCLNGACVHSGCKGGCSCTTKSYSCKTCWSGWGIKCRCTYRCKYGYCHKSKCWCYGRSGVGGRSVGYGGSCNSKIPPKRCSSCKTCFCKGQSCSWPCQCVTNTRKASGCSSACAPCFGDDGRRN